MLALFLSLMLCMSMTFISAPKALAHACYIGQRFGTESGHRYVEFDITYQEDWNETTWTISPSSVWGQTLQVWALPTNGKLRIGFPSLFGGLMYPPGYSPSDFVATPAN